MVAAGFVLGAAYNRHGPDDAPKETTARSTKRGEYWLLRPDLATRPRRRCARNKDALREVKVTADDASIIRTGFRLRYDLLGTARRAASIIVVILINVDLNGCFIICRQTTSYY